MNSSVLVKLSREQSLVDSLTVYNNIDVAVERKSPKNFESCKPRQIPTRLP